MSELKAGVIHTPHDEGMTFVTDSDTISVNEHETEFYIKSEADKVIAHHKRKRCLAMARWCEATALWCYQAANTLPAGFQATLYGKPVMIEPSRLFKRHALLTKWSAMWNALAAKFKPNNSTAQ